MTRAAKLGSALIFFVVWTVVAATLAVGAGLLVAHVRGGSRAAAVAVSLWLVGGLMVLLTAASNDPARRQASRWSGVGAVNPVLTAPGPATPLIVLLIGLVLIAVGVLVDLRWAAL